MTYMKILPESSYLKEFYFSLLYSKSILNNIQFILIKLFFDSKFFKNCKTGYKSFSLSRKMPTKD